MKWKTWKKFGVIAMAVIMGAAFLAGCGSDSNNASSANKKELTYSKSQGPYSDLFEKGIKPILEKKGYKVTGKDMSDLLQADVALNEGEVDFNVEQHTAYMENFNQKQRLNYAKEDTLAIIKNVYKYVIIGVGIGALIHNYIPQDLILKILGDNNPFSVIIASVVGIPMYADIFGTIPIAEALFMAGVPIGTVLAFMMSVTALSLPSMIMLSKVVKPKLLAIFIGIVTVGIIITGYLFNAIGPFLM